MNWEPIEKAPKENGKRLLVWFGTIGIWYKDAYYSPGGYGYEEGYSGWVDEEGIARYDSPSHWMPIPEGPGGAKCLVP